MKKEKDTDSFKEKMKAKGWREISRSKTPHPKSPKSSGEVKSRITIYLDADIVSYYKEIAEDSGSGYQTLINRSLREIVDGRGQTESSDIKQDILQDEAFLHELREALAIKV
jgi:uncharacterized protein (DUF4415 family)